MKIKEKINSTTIFIFLVLIQTLTITILSITSIIFNSFFAETLQLTNFYAAIILLTQLFNFFFSMEGILTENKYQIIFYFVNNITLIIRITYLLIQELSISKIIERNIFFLIICILKISVCILPVFPSKYFFEL
jgi:hypothetical protein